MTKYDPKYVRLVADMFFELDENDFSNSYVSMPLHECTEEDWV